jgi:hypothetical protein
MADSQSSETALFQMSPVISEAIFARLLRGLVWSDKSRQVPQHFQWTNCQTILLTPNFSWVIFQPFLMNRFSGLPRGAEDGPMDSPG